MVLEEPLDVDEEELVPSFEQGKSKLSGSDIPRSEETTKALTDFERHIVPNMFDLEWMNKAAKARASPFYNERDQNMTAHILPGVECAADIVEQAPSINPSDFREIVALWTIHDIHKIIKNDNGEFEISMDTVEEWVMELELPKFAPELDIEDYHSCAVGLHNSEDANIDDSTTAFTRLRPALRLIDAILSIDSPDNYVEQAERPVSAVFSRPNEMYVPVSHTVEFDDAVLRTIANKSVYQELSSYGFEPIDIRDDGALYVRSENCEHPKDKEEFAESLVNRFTDNLRDSYQIFRNRAYLGGDIDSPQSRSGYGVMPRVYEVSDLAKVCLDEVEIIQRIVQAAVEQQNRPWEISDESKRQIEKVESVLDLEIDDNSFVEGMATLVHTVYREILPYIVDETSEQKSHRTLESAILKVFDVSREYQELFLEAVKSPELNSSAVSWSQKYVIAKYLHDRFTVEYSRKERQRELIELLSENLSDFTGWESFSERGQDSLRNEIFLRLVANVKIDGVPITEYNREEFMSRIENHNKRGACSVCGMATSESSNSPSLLSHRDYDVTDVEFVTRKGNSELENLNISDAIPVEPICVTCQLALTIRAQQFDSYESGTELHVTVHPVTSTSAASYTRFNKILQYLKTEAFAEDEERVPYTEVGQVYKDMMDTTLSQNSGINSIVNRKQAFDVGTRMDEASSRLAIPSDTEEDIARAVTCVTMAALLSGVRVCITRNPQLHMNHSEDNSFIIYGPELQHYNDFLDNAQDVTGLPDKIRILDRLMVLGDKTESPNLSLERYSNLSDRNVVPGSRVFAQIRSTIDSEYTISTAKDAVYIDAVASQNDVFAKDIIVASSNIAEPLSEVCEDSEVDKIYSILMACFDKNADTSVPQEDVLGEIKDIVANEVPSVGVEALREGGSIHKFARQFLKTRGKLGAKSMNQARRPLIDATVTRTLMYRGDDDD